MRRFSKALLVVLGMLPAVGCIQEEVTQTLYLSSSGVVWSVLEKDVRSDENDLAKRISEEQNFFLAANAGAHGVAKAMQELGAQSVKTTWLRRERPYSVMTEGRFSDIRQLATAFLRDSEAQGDVSLERTGCQTRLSVRVDLRSSSESPKDSALGELMTDLKTYRIVLTEGRFISADGFDISDEGMVAVPDAKKKADDGMLTLSLVWGDDGCVVK
jgi:hypothetical protein